MDENCKRSQGSQRAVVLLKKKKKKKNGSPALPQILNVD